MFQKFLGSPVFRSKFLHYFVILSSLTFLFTLGPRILIDQLSSSKPNTALAQDCGQQPCPSVPVPPQPPQECTTSCQPGMTGTCGGHKYWDEDGGHYGDCQCETAAQTCQAPQPTPQPPQPTPQACTPNEVVSTTQHCVGAQMCTFNVQHRADCSTFEGGAFGCQNSTACGFSNPTPAPQPHQNTCGGLTVGQSTCQSGHQVFCKGNAPECNGNDCIVDTGATCGNGTGGSTNSCQDLLNNCSCNGTSFVCNHQHTDCSNTSETHNELSGASACQTNTTCTDQLLNCSCNGTNFHCTHQMSNCSTTIETHNELSGASACQPGVVTTPAPGVGGTSSSNSTSNSNSAANSSSNSTANATAQQQQSQSQNTNVSNVNNNNNTNNNSQNQTVNVSAINWATPIPTASPTATPTTVPTTVTSQCPTGTVFQRMEGNTIFCQQNANASSNVVVGQGGGVPRVVGQTQVQGTSTVQELPNTGLPAVGLLLVGLGPIGWKLRRYAFKSFDPSSIWVGRELKK